VIAVSRFVTLLIALAAPAAASPHTWDDKLDAALMARAHESQGDSRVIVRPVPGERADVVIRAVGARAGRRLAEGTVAYVPDVVLDALAARPEVMTVSLDRPVVGTIEQTAAAIGVRWVQENLGVDGSGVGVAMVDSGVTGWHDDLGTHRVVHFADFVNALPGSYDDYGHGTHVAGIIAGNGYDSGGARRGLAPGANLIALKVLDGSGAGFISNVIAAIDYAITNKAAYNIRVLNLSVAAGVYESYNTDPLSLAARRAVEAGIVVVAAAGNFGRDALGTPQYGGITAPGNAPWVLTVGASNHMGTADRSDDMVAAFSSRGPSVIDYSAKPDIVAPGVGIESTSDPSATLFAANASGRIWGTAQTASQPYLSLTGTSMAAPVATGTIALMLQANPALSPNAVKAILQFTAEYRPGYDVLTQGAGFLNARGAVQLARLLAQRSRNTPSTESLQSEWAMWSRHIIWGNRLVAGGVLSAFANAWQPSVMWGAERTPSGEPVVWGSLCDAASPQCGNEPWGMRCSDDSSPCESGGDTVADGGAVLCDADCHSSPAHDSSAVADMWPEYGGSNPIQGTWTMTNGARDDIWPLWRETAWNPLGDLSHRDRRTMGRWR
jgi:serine protease AprX